MYNFSRIDDTIAAISTPIGAGGIGIVRLSGKDSLSIADRIFVSKDGKRPLESKTFTLHYGFIVDPDKIEDRKKIIDEVLLTVMKAPKTYTKEDIVEINCHSGIVPLRKILELVLRVGARLAEPGEFTKRAFLNGRIDLAQAEAVFDIVNSKTELALDTAISQLSGKLSQTIKQIEDSVLDIKADLEASIDFSEESLFEYRKEDFLKRLSLVKNEVARLIDASNSGRIIREGLRCVICGRPNVGKSSLMNALLGYDRVIVTHIPGTTRDLIEEYINIDGIPIRLIDTAGIGSTNDCVEVEGIRRTKDSLKTADLVLLVLDVEVGLIQQDLELIEFIKDKEVIVVLNKIDLGCKIDISKKDLQQYFLKDVPFVKISALKKLNLKDLIDVLKQKIWSGQVICSDSSLLVNARHKELLSSVIRGLDEARNYALAGFGEEILADCLQGILQRLGEITGRYITEEVLVRIFERFCVGK